MESDSKDDLTPQLPEETGLVRILPINIEDELKASYINYSMSVIVGRALPDVRDGLKPVHRRVLYGMMELGLSAGSAQKKSARIVGEVLGKYHPHGDSAVYDTMVRMAQDFSMRYPLVDGQGNFGSVDGDAAAAMRYTEARMTRLAEELLKDINKETVAFQENFDGSLEEPTVLPAGFPQLLVNGSDGIAVGMATKIPPHNLGEAIDAVVAYIDNPDISIDALMKHLPAPDFPTGGIIYGYAGVKEAYYTGRGRVIMRARMTEEEVRPGRPALIVTEIPYQVNKSALIEKIAALAREKRLEGISDLRDESDRDGMRIVIELKKDAVPQVVQNHLYKLTAMQQTFGVNIVALVQGRPRTLSLKECIQYYVEHREEVVTRRTQFDLRKAEERAHILEGLTRALDHLDAVIAIIRHSPDTDSARANLMAGRYPAQLSEADLRRMGLPLQSPVDLTGSIATTRMLGVDDDAESLYWLSGRQADAILALRLSRLTGLERQKIEEEYKGVLMEIERLRSILNSPALLMQVIKDELLDIRSRFADARRTEIDYAGGADFLMEDMVEDEQVVVTLTHQSLIKRTPATEYRMQHRGGMGQKAVGTRDEDYVEHLFTCSNHDYLLFFTAQGKCFWMRVFEIPEGSRVSKGRSIRNIIQISGEDRVKAVLPIAKHEFSDATFLENHFVLMVTQQGLVNKTRLEDFSRPRTAGINAISIQEGDDLIEAVLTDGNKHVMLASTEGKSIRFHESDVRPTGRGTQGVRGMNLEDGHRVVSMLVFDPAEADAGTRQILSISANGYGKRTDINEYSLQSRGGKGVVTLNVTEKTGALASARCVSDQDNLMIVTTAGIMIRLGVHTIRATGRNAMGVRLINIREGDAIADVTQLVVDEEEEAPEAAPELPLE